MSVPAFGELPTTFVGHKPLKVVLIEKSHSSSEDMMDTIYATFYDLTIITGLCVLIGFFCTF